MRSVVLKPTARCPRCQLPPRWCVCTAHRESACPLQISVLMHHREWNRPSSTGRLIERVIPTACVHVWRPESSLSAADVRRPGRDLWILHPHGNPAPAGVLPAEVQVLLLDGSWRETSAMVREVSGWGRLVSLPMTGVSRYWLRAQADALRFSTVEALLYVLKRFRLDEVHDAVRLQFELHVYATLRARGYQEEARRFLTTSPSATMFPELIAQLDVRRPA